MVPSPQDEGRKAGEVKEIGFKAWRPELRAGSRHSLELDRAEPIGEMHGKDGNQENGRHRYAGERHQRTEKHSQATKYLNQDRKQSHEMRGRHAQGLQKKIAGNASRPLASLAKPCSMKPYPTIRRSGIGAQRAIGDLLIRSMGRSRHNGDCLRM